MSEEVCIPLEPGFGSFFHETVSHRLSSFQMPPILSLPFDHVIVLLVMGMLKILKIISTMLEVYGGSNKSKYLVSRMNLMVDGMKQSVRRAVVHKGDCPKVRCLRVVWAIQDVR